MKFSYDRPYVLAIIDGWGLAEEAPENAIANAFTPNLDRIVSSFSVASLNAAGESVGLSTGSSGNAEAGHFNIGAGRVVESDLSKLSAAISSGDFFENPTLKNALEGAGSEGRPVHLIGLVSDGGVHSSSATLYALLRMAKMAGVQHLFVHGVLDGRDAPPRSAEIYIEALEIKMCEIGLGKIASLCGRHFAMNADENWDRTARCFTLMVHAEGESSTDAGAAIRASYLRGIDDEFIAPIVIEEKEGVPIATIKNGDTVIFFNHRADTMRQLVRAVAVPDPLTSTATKPRLDVVCLTEFDKSFNLPVAFRAGSGGSGLNEVFSRCGVPNFRIAEPERFPHVTAFLNGGSDQSNQFQQNIAVVGPKASIYDTYPEMGSFKLADQVVSAIDAGETGVFIANFSAADLMAEAGEAEKTKEALQFIDTCIGSIFEAVEERSGVMMITSSHGHFESLKPQSDLTPRDPGTENPVPFVFADTLNSEVRLKATGSLCDIAPTVLAAIGIEPGEAMTGADLRVS